MEQGTDYSRIRCPFWKKKWGKIITCQGFAPGTNVNLTFIEAGLQIEYMENFCCTECWKGCPIAQAAAENEE